MLFILTESENWVWQSFEAKIPTIISILSQLKTPKAFIDTETGFESIEVE